MDIETRLRDLLERLHQRGQRTTPQRVAILRAFLNAADHPTVEQVYRRVCLDFPMTSLATVYKTIALLKELGEVIEITGSEVGNRYDAQRPEPHPHLICTRCGRIFDGESVEVEAVVTALQRRAAFRVSTYRMDLYGTCADCHTVSNRF
ncbi:MAG: Fur family transcriptional regulator [Bellilinea sp.]